MKAAQIADEPGVLGAFMLAPAVLYIVAFVGIPFLLSIALCVSSATVGDPSIHGYVGLRQFADALSDPQFRVGLRNSLLVTFASIVALLVLATAQSELLAGDFKGKRVVEILIILPWAMPVSLSAITWLWLLHPEFSPIDWFLRHVHLLGPGTWLGPAGHMYYFGREWLGLASIVTMNVWRMLPLATIIVLAGRRSIPEELFEQAQVDGAGFFRVLFRITIPALMPVLMVAVVFTALMIIGDMSLVALTTRGGPGYSTMLLPYWAFLKGIEGGDLSGGAAVALFLLPVLLAAAVVALRVASRAEQA